MQITSHLEIVLVSVVTPFGVFSGSNVFHWMDEGGLYKLSNCIPIKAAICSSGIYQQG